MDEFEQATLAYQAAALAARHAGLWISAAHVGVGLLQAGIVWYGIRAMVRASGERAVVLDQQRQADDKRHEEAMAEGARRHEEAMAEGARRHEEAMGALKALIGGLERQTASLETVVERTAPTAGPAE